MFEAMAMTGMHPEMLAAIHELWGPMIDADATTWWECFGGDDRDSLCHPWSSAPNYVLMRHMLGIAPAAAGFAEVEVRPRPDLIDHAVGTVRTVRGDVTVGWNTDEEMSPYVAALLPDGVPGSITLPDGWIFDATGEGHVSLPDGGNGKWAIREQE